MTITPATVDLAALLDGLVRRDGLALLDDRGRLHGLLRDYAPDAIPGIRTMMAAYDGGLVGRLRDGPMPLPAGAVEREIAAVTTAAGCDAVSAGTAVASWVRVVAAARTESAGPPLQLPLPSSGPLPLPSSGPLPMPLPGTPAGRSRPIRLAGGIGAAIAMAAVAARMLGYL